MFGIEFENETGKVVLCGGDHPLLHPLSISGLGRPETEEHTTVFGSEPGQKLLLSRDKPRTITINGHIYDDNSRTARASRILYSPGVLTLRSDTVIKAISARCIRFSDKNMLESGGYSVSLTFVCDSPYFHDPEPRQVRIYSRVRRLSTPFTLPAVFSERITEGNCFNDGQIACEPTLIIENHGTAQQAFTIQNLTTGASLHLTASIPEQEVITISVPDRTIYNKDGTNLLYALSESSYLSDFYLAPGENVLKFSSSGDMRCDCLYHVHYTECIL